MIGDGAPVRCATDTRLACAGQTVDRHRGFDEA